MITWISPTPLSVFCFLQEIPDLPALYASLLRSLQQRFLIDFFAQSFKCADRSA
jgi:hypothetical protein